MAERGAIVMKQVSVVAENLWSSPGAGEFIPADERTAPVDGGRRQMAGAINDLFKELLRQVGGEGKPLGDADRDAHARERARTATDSPKRRPS